MTDRDRQDAWLQRLWYEAKPGWAVVLLTPLSGLFRIIVTARRACYRLGLLRSVRLPRPVVVVGNVMVGGVGKTPLIIWLAEQLQARGMRIGVILRGYGGEATRWPVLVSAQTSAKEVGDEAKLIAERTQAIVVAGPDRVADARLAIEAGAQLILSDDGLQHYRLARDAEIAVLDVHRSVGNGWLLPTGPLREPVERLNTVDLVVCIAKGPGRTSTQALTWSVRAMQVRAELREAVNLVSGERRPLEAFVGQRAHAVAGIGNPDAFFSALAEAGLHIEPHAYADHAQFDAAALQFPGAAPVLMTEKDAVKCRAFASPRFWSVRMELVFTAHDAAKLLRVVEGAAGGDSV